MLFSGSWNHLILRLAPFLLFLCSPSSVPHDASPPQPEQATTAQRSRGAANRLPLINGTPPLWEARLRYQSDSWANTLSSCRSPISKRWIVSLQWIVRTDEWHASTEWPSSFLNAHQEWDIFPWESDSHFSLVHSNLQQGLSCLGACLLLPYIF